MPNLHSPPAHHAITTDYQPLIEIVPVLNDVLAHTLDLGLHARQAHWNIAGPQFAAVHDGLGRFIADIDEASDAIAERVAQLGGIAEGTICSIQHRSTLNTYPLGIDGDEHVAVLASAVRTTGAVLRHALDDRDVSTEPVSVDVLTGVLRMIEKWRWYLDAQLRHPRGHGGRS